MKTNASPSSSPEFEFWMVRNPSLPPSNLLTADELFLNGVLLPLQLLSLPSSTHPVQPQTGPQAEPSPAPPPSPSSILYSASSSSSLSRRWKDLFKLAPEKKLGEKNLRKKELNIWPFTRSQSVAGRPRSTGPVSGRKVSSAPCSRSNSRGEAPVSRLGRSSPVWQNRRVRLGPKDKTRMWAHGPGGSGVRVLNLNVNNCIGYGEKVSSMGEDSDGIPGGDRIAEGNLTSGFSTTLRALFSKKIH